MVYVGRSILVNVEYKWMGEMQRGGICLSGSHSLHNIKNMHKDVRKI